MTRRRVLLIGGTGVFGSRLAHHLARFDGLDLILSSRDGAKAKALARTIRHAKGTQVSGIGLDHRHHLAARLAEIAPWLVIDASGPFQGADYDVPRGALEAGAHVVDLADARDYILGYGAALDELARSRGLVALAGASSTPALSTAAAAELTRGWRRTDTIDIAITPGGRSEVGAAVIAAILTYAGRPVPVWREGELQETTGWLDSRVVTMPRLRRQRVAAVETVDAQALGPTLGVTSRVAFQAGLESWIEQWGLMALARLRQAGLVGSLDGLIPLLILARKLTRITTSDRGGMLVAATGLDDSGELRHARWSLVATRDDGPQVPTLAAAAAVCAIRGGLLEPGARSAGGALSLAQIEAEMQPYAIVTKIEAEPDDHGLFEQALGGTAFAALPEPLRAFHGTAGSPVWRGRALVENGRNPIAWLIRRLIGLPEAGEDVPVTVSVERVASETGKAEIWIRNFGGSRFASRLYLDRENRLHERFGPVRFRLGLAARDGQVRLPVVAASVLGLPLHRFLLPRSEAIEEVDGEGRFRFDVKLTLPLFGLLVRYAGWLTPKA
ncbi:SDR family oxidoreductase [Bosea sp. AS-1]|uniref:SDR family oxidoreductase n=1 Tax=Bosea sp. AS-1 TaxID=2015316 RepID=UPI000B799CA7|nr:SDR family oxidoreductase [Bosea sp. AS-1]